MLKYLAVAASLAVASCGANPAFAAECPKGTVPLADAIASLESYGDRFEVIGVFPIAGTSGTSHAVVRDGERVYAALTIHGCLLPDSSQYVGKFKKDRDA